jgi:hypothetical protein
MKNFENFFDNIETKPLDNEVMMEEVNQYTKISKNYKQQYKENVKNPDYYRLVDEDFKEDLPKVTPKEDDEFEKLWNCQRMPDKKQQLQTVPLGEKQ